MMTLNFPNTPLGFDALRKSLPSDTIKNLIIGKYWILIETHCGVGLVATPPQPNSAEFAKELHVVKGQSTNKVIDFCYSQNALKRAIGCATINALINTTSLKLSSENGLDINTNDDERVVIVGRFPGLEQKLPNAYVIERSPGPKDYPESAAPQLIPKCDQLIITASTWVNGSLEPILSLVKNAQVSIIGPGTPMSPLLGRYGISRLAGFIATNPKKLSKLIAREAGVKQFKHLGRFGVLNIGN